MRRSTAAYLKEMIFRCCFKVMVSRWWWGRDVGLNKISLHWKLVLFPKGVLRIFFGNWIINIYLFTCLFVYLLFFCLLVHFFICHLFTYLQSSHIGSCCLFVLLIHLKFINVLSFLFILKIFNPVTLFLQTTLTKRKIMHCILIFGGCNFHKFIYMGH